MALIVGIDLVVIVSLIVASRRRLEDALPVFCFFVVLLPFESRLVIPGLFDLTTERVALFTLFVLFLIRRAPARSTYFPLKGLILLHVVWVLCSTVYSLSAITSVKQLIAQVVEYYLFFYIVVKTTSDVRTVYKTLYTMTVALGICCIFAMFEAYALWSILNIFPPQLWTTYDSGHGLLYIEWGRGLRVRSTFPHPILFGDALAMCIPVTLYLLGVWKHQVQRGILWACLILMFWGIYKTSSRGPWIAVGISCVVLFLLVHNRVRKYLAVMAILCVLVLFARPGVWQTILNLYVATQDLSNPVGTSYEYRHVVMEAVNDAVQKEPGRTLFGYGPGAFREFGLDIDFQNVVQRWYTCDNNWALFLYETGYGGLVIVALLLLKPLLMAIHSYQRLPRPEKHLSAVFFISLIAFYFSLLSVAGYNWGQQGFMAWTLIALSVVYPRIVLREKMTSMQAPLPIDSGRLAAV
jgi:hypothetical protein